MLQKDNIVKNVVTFLGPDASVRQLRRKMWMVCNGNRDIVFNPEAILPFPKNLGSRDEAEEFCRKTWGCPGSIMADMELSANCISFETFDHPPRGAFKRISELYPDVSVLVEFARYDNKGFDGAGQILYQNGKATEACVTNDFAETLLNDIKGTPFSISRSCVFDFDKQNKEVESNEAIVGIAQKLLKKEQQKLLASLRFGSFLTTDTNIISSSAVIKQLEKNCNSLGKIIDEFSENIPEKKTYVNVQEILQTGQSLSFESEKEVPVIKPGKSGKVQTTERSVLTKPKYFRRNTLDSEHGDRE